MLTAYLQRIITPVVERSIGNAITQRHHEDRKAFESLERLRGLVVATALKEMFEGSHFSISTIDSCLKAARVIPDGDVYDTLRPLHCVNWSKMPPELRREVFARVVTMFGGDVGYEPKGGTKC